jgi:hypothetical protein
MIYKNFITKVKLSTEVIAFWDCNSKDIGLYHGGIDPRERKRGSRAPLLTLVIFILKVFLYLVHFCHEKT